MTLSELTKIVKEQGGFDHSDSVIQGWINDRYRQMVGRSQWRMAQITLGTTIAGTSEYPLPNDVVDLSGLMVGGVTYDRAGQKQLWDLKRTGGSQTVFVPDFTSTGTAQIELYPNPSTSGATIEGLAALLPSRLVDAADTPIVPDDLQDALVDGAIATGLRRIDEHLPEADNYEQRFTDKTEELRRRLNSRIGSGPHMIRVAV